MRFRKMKINNFRQFKGEHEIIFSLDEKRNVTVITGNNGAGKTTLLQAFNWCLYGSGQVKLENPDELLNKELISNLAIGNKEKVEICIELEHSNKVYTCRHYIVYIRNADSNVKKLDEEQFFDVTDLETGETKRSNQNAIREIFPRDLSTYFLFDGERMQDLVDNQRVGKKDLSNAVKNLLGLDVLENSKYHLEKAKREFESEFVSEKTDDLERLNFEINDFYEKIETEQKNKKECEDELEVLEKKRTEINEVLKSYDGLRSLQTKRNDLASQLNKTEKDIEQKKEQIFKIFGSCSANFYLGSSFDKIREQIKKSSLHDKGIEGIDGKAIDSILKMGKCICGCDLSINSKAREELENWKKFLPPESYSVLLKGLEVNMKHIDENNNSFYDNFNKYYEEYNDKINQKDILLNKINENEKKIADIGDKDLSELNREYLELGNMIANKNQSIGSSKAEIEGYKDKLRIREEARSNLAVSNNLNEVIRYKVDICQKLINDFTNRLNQKEKQVKENLQTKTSELLSKMLSSNKIIEIEDDYNFTITDEYKTTTLSEGEKIVTSFAFVGAIITVAKSFIEKEENNKNDDSKFALVMDAPFAKLDLAHRKSVTEQIPNLTDQIILFSADSQWDDVVKNSLSSKIGVMYNIKKLESSLSVIQKVEEVE